MTDSVYPDDYLACEVCEAVAGGACYALLAAGPEALPSRYAERPHSSRKLRGESRKTLARPAKTQVKATPPVRRAARKTQAQATGWAAVALEQQRKREAKDGLRREKA